jgi:hypothetical protein
MRLHWLRFSCGFRRSNPHSKQQLHVGRSSKYSCFAREQVLRRQSQLGSENTWFRALVSTRREKEHQYQLRLGYDKIFSAVHNWYSLCNNRKINNRSCYTYRIVPTQPCLINECVNCWCGCGRSTRNISWEEKGNLALWFGRLQSFLATSVTHYIW